MAVESARPAIPVAREQRMPIVAVGIIIFLGSELMFFASLFGMYFTLRAQDTVWTPSDLPILRPMIFSAVLVASSFTMQTAVRRIKRNNVSGLRRWIVITMIMGAIFLVGQGWDYLDLSNAGISIATDAWGSAFFTMTGFHALHVTAGILAMLVLLGRSLTGTYTSRNHGAIEAVTYYWHFVDIVWVALYLTIFIIR